MSLSLMKPQLSVAVIVPVHNGHATLESCLIALQASRRTPAEVIVVDDASTDDSGEIAQRYGARVVRLAEQRGPAAARNTGARSAQSSFLLFLDADVCVHPAAIERACKVLETHPDATAAFGAYDDSPRASGLISQFRNLLHHFTHRVSRTSASTFWAGCGIIRREEFFRHGGFDESFSRPSIEDIELGMRMSGAGARIVLDSNIQVCHLKRWSVSEILRTDIFDRAWPWSRLLLQQGRLPNDLNLRWSQRIASVCAWAAVISAAGSAFSTPLLWGFILSVLGAGAMNFRFLGYLARIRGWSFATRSFPMILIYLLYSSGTFLAAVVYQACQPSACSAAPVLPARRSEPVL